MPTVPEICNYFFTSGSGTYSDGTSQNMTTQVAWNSSSGNVATISNTAGTKGLVTSGPSAGTTTISASVGSVSGSTILTVVQQPPEFLYAASWSLSNISVYSINPTTGALSAVGTPVVPGGHPTRIVARWLIQ
jgi:6-phosphogluconolactonase (cycloisomerase 2 family)